MTYKLNTLVDSVSAPPISESAQWIANNQSNLEPINLSQAVPSYLPAPELAEHVAKCMTDGSANLYTDILGMPELRAELAAHMGTAYQGDVRRDDVAITAGCNQAFSTAMQALAEPGDNVIVPAPWYFNHQMWLDMLGVEIRTIPAMKDGTALPDPADIAAVCDERTRAVVLVTPNNPTGGVYPPELIERFFEECKARKLALVIDETYKDFLKPKVPAHTLFQRTDWRDTFIQLYSFSKVYALTGSRIGSIIAGPDMIEASEKIIDCVAICAPHSGQHAALYGLRNLKGWKEQKRLIMEGRLEAMRSSLAKYAPNYTLISSGAFFAYVQHPYEGVDAKQIAIGLAQDTGVLTLPGTMFGPNQNAYLRLAFANIEAHQMEEVARRIGKYEP